MNAKRIIALILSISMLISVVACSKNTEESADETTAATEAETKVSEEAEETNTTNNSMYVIRESAIPDGYLEIITIANNVVENSIAQNDNPVTDREGYHGIYEEAYYLGEEAFEHICFALADINDDGVDELIIADRIFDDGVTEFVGPVERAGYGVLAVYTLNGDEAVLLAEGWVRNNWYINSDGELINEGSSGAAYHEIGVYHMDPETLELVNTYRLYSDYDEEYVNITLYEEIGDSISIVEAEDYWDTFDNARDQLTAEMFELELVPINSALV